MDRDPGSITWVHASAVVFGEIGLLVRGPAGAGKTTLAFALIKECRAAGRFARLVADDTVGLQPFGERLVARPHPRTAGMAERRGVGILSVEHEPACVVRMVVDFASATEGRVDRFPEPEDLQAVLMGLVFPRLSLRQMAATSDNVHRVLEQCHTFRPGS